MKLNSLLFSTFMLTAFIMVAQDWSTDVYKYGTLYPGYVIDKDGNKMEGFIRYNNRYSLQNTVIFFGDKNDKKSKIKYKSQELTEYKVADKLYHAIHYSDGLLNKQLRGNLVVNEGCIMEYVWYDRDDNYASMSKTEEETDKEFMNRKFPPTTLFLKDGENDVKTIAKFALKFTYKMSAWIGDNLDLAGKVAAQEKGYEALNMLQIIEEYNDDCEK